MLLKLPLPQGSIRGLLCEVFKQCLRVLNSSEMKTLRALLAHISVSLLNQESPDFPTVWQFQGDPMWVETRAPAIFHRGNRLHPGYLGLWGVFQESPSIWEAFPSRLALSHLQSLISAQDCAGFSSPHDTKRAHCWGPNCSNCGSNFQMETGEASGASDPALASVSTAVASQRSSGHQRAKY